MALYSAPPRQALWRTFLIWSTHLLEIILTLVQKEYCCWVCTCIGSISRRCVTFSMFPYHGSMVWFTIFLKRIVTTVFPTVVLFLSVRQIQNCWNLFSMIRFCSILAVTTVTSTGPALLTFSHYYVATPLWPTALHDLGESFVVVLDI